MVFAPSSLILTNYYLPLSEALCVKEFAMTSYSPPDESVKGMNYIRLSHCKNFNIHNKPCLDRGNTLKLFINVLVIILSLQLVACGGDELENDNEQVKVTEPVISPILAPDKTPPVITLNGNRYINLISDENYVELGATATDDSDEFIEIVITGYIIPHREGEYTVTYTATDSSNNTSTIERTVRVVEALDITPPVITLNGGNAISWVLGESYIGLGATAFDERDGIVDVVINEAVDINTLGDYNIVYTASDNSGNTSSVIRAVSIVPNLANAFITTWKTDNQGYGANNQIRIYTSSLGLDYNYQVNWGDDSTDYNVTGYITHTYKKSGVYTVSITGRFPQILFLRDDNEKLLSVEQWGNIQWQSMSKAFYQCTKLVINAVDTPDLSQVTNMSEMFSGATALDQDLNSWDVSAVTNMQGMFKDAVTFNKELNNWRVSSVINMNEMFQGAKSFNQSLNNWDVSSVKEMWAMFKYASEFNEPLNDWDVSSVTDMWRMFYDAETFNQPLDNWDVSSVTDMNSIFDQTNMSTQNYDALLLAWSVQNLEFDVRFSAVNITFSSASEDARNKLIEFYNWEISDGGIVP